MACILDSYRKNECVESVDRCAHAIAINGRIDASKMPREYRGITLFNSPARESQSTIYNKLGDYIETFGRIHDETDSRRIKSIYLYSKNPGTGKTTTAIALLNQFIIASYLGALKRDMRPPLRPVFFLDLNELQSSFNLATQTRDEGALKRFRKTIEIASFCPFVAIDDIGLRSATEAFRGHVHTIINARCANGLPTVYTSNIPIDELTTIFDARLADRVRDQCAVFAFDGESKRGRR